MILRKYNNIEYVLSMDPAHFLRFVTTMIEKQTESTLREEWIALLPRMLIGQLKFQSFDEYVDRRTGRNIDTRSNEEIIAEIEALHNEGK